LRIGANRRSAVALPTRAHPPVRQAEHPSNGRARLRHASW